MRTIAILALLFFPLFAGFFPSSVHTSVTSVEGSSIQLKNKFPVNGMSGIIIHTYGNGQSAITSRIKQTSSTGSATLLHTDILHHDELPTINTSIKKGDKVIGGYLYNTVLLLAPDANTYANITHQYPHKTWIHPDLFALYLSTQGEDVPSKKNLSDFAKAYHVGLIYIIRKNSAILFDPISQTIISQQNISHLPKEGQYPFYMRLNNLKSGWFKTNSKGNYYQMIGAL